MRYRLLGNSGLRVSELSRDDDVRRRAGVGRTSTRAATFETFLEAGGTVDTANNYTLGTSEQFLGELIGPHRERLVVATKATMTSVRDDPNAGGNQRKNLVQTVDRSPPAAEDQLPGPALDPRLGRRHAGRGADADAGRPGAPGQGALCRDLERAGPGWSRRRTRSPASEAGRRSWGSRSSTTWPSGRPSARCCRWRRRWAWG